MKSTAVSALPILVATFGLIAAIGAVSKSAAELEPEDAARLSRKDRLAAAQPGATLEMDSRAAVTAAPAAPRPEATSGPAWTSSTPSTARRSEVSVPRNYRPSLRGVDVPEEQLGAEVAKLAPLERQTLEALRLRYLALPTRIEQSLLGRDLPSEDFAYEQAISGLCQEIEALLVDCHRDFYANRRFPYRRASEGPLDARPVGNSQFTTQGLFVVGDWYVDAGFRSADYPDLQHMLEQAQRMQIEREDFLDRSLNVR